MNVLRAHRLCALFRNIHAQPCLRSTLSRTACVCAILFRIFIFSFAYSTTPFTYYEHLAAVQELAQEDFVYIICAIWLDALYVELVAERNRQQQQRRRQRTGEIINFSIQKRRRRSRKENHAYATRGEKKTSALVCTRGVLARAEKLYSLRLSATHTHAHPPFGVRRRRRRRRMVTCTRWLRGLGLSRRDFTHPHTLLCT